MASPLSQKPLNPHAESWFPLANKPSEDFTRSHKLSLSVPHEIYGTIPSGHFSSAEVDEGCSQPQPFQSLPPVAVFQAPNQEFIHYVAIEHQYWLSGCFSVYPIYPVQKAYDGFLVEKNEIFEVKDGKMEKLLESNSIKESFGMFRGRPNFLSKFVPPRLRKSLFEEFQGGRKRLSRKVWKPKNANGVAAAEIVPQASSFEDEESPDHEKTTVMLKNIPNQYRRDSLMEFLDTKCFELKVTYDFLYLPMDFIKGDNLGFAFVNLTTAPAAMKIKSALKGYKWGEFCIPNGKFTSKKILEITWAKIQGKDALIRHFENSRFTCDNTQYLPVVIFPPSNGSFSTSKLTTIGKMQGFYKFSMKSQNK